MTWAWTKTPAGRLAVIAPSGRVLAEVSTSPEHPIVLAMAIDTGKYLDDVPAAVAWAETELSRLAADLLAAGGGR